MYGENNSEKKNFVYSLEKMNELFKKIDSSQIFTEEEKNAIKTLADKVDKIPGKSLIADAEIARLAGVSNYDDTAVKAEIAALKPSTITITNPDTAKFSSWESTCTISNGVKYFRYIATTSVELKPNSQDNAITLANSISQTAARPAESAGNAVQIIIDGMNTYAYMSMSSTGGMYLFTPDILPAGTRIVCRMTYI